MKSVRNSDSAGSPVRKQAKHADNGCALLNNNSPKWRPKSIENTELGVRILPGNVGQQPVTAAADENGKEDLLKNGPSLTMIEQKPSDFLFRRRKLSADRPNHGNLFSKLSDELILMIMHYLPKRCLSECAMVSQRWRRICYDEVLWTRIDISRKNLPSDTLAYVLMRNPRVLRMVQTLVQTPLFQEMSQSMEDFACKVEYLDLSMSVIESDDLAALLSKCSELRKLSLEHCTTDFKVCSSIAQNKNLETLNMALCYSVEANGITKILKECKNIEDLNLAWTNLDEDTVTAVCSLASKSMKNLNLSGCGRNINDAHIEQLVKTCTHLTELDLSDNTQLKDETVEIVMKSLPKLQSISFSRCYRILPAMYGKLIKMPSLKSLNIFGLLHDRQVELLRESMPRVHVNKAKFSCVARPTVGIRRTSIWGIRVRD